MERRRATDIGFLVILSAFAALLSLSGQAAANPVTTPMTVCLLPIALVALVLNFPVNLALVELVVYAGLVRRGTQVFRTNVPSRLVRKMVYGCLIVSVIGGFVDLYFLYADSSEISFDVVLWSSALFLIFVSLVLPMYFLIQVELDVALLAGLADVVVNALAWSAYLMVTETQAFVLACAMIVGGLALSLFLWDRMSKWFSKKVESALKKANSVV